MNDITTLPTVPVEEVLRASKLDSASLQRSQLAYKRLFQMQTGLPAGWHGPSDIVTLIGLEGDFVWYEDWVRPGRISFHFDPGMEGHQGVYTLTRALGPSEQGVFHCVPNNPAIGWAFVNLQPAGGNNRGFIVAGMMTDSAWRISILMLNKLGADGPVNPPFSALRIL